MILQIPGVLGPGEVAEARRLLDEAAWVDGRVTAGPQSARAKDNLQLAETDPVARQLGELIVDGLAAQSAFHLGRAAAAGVPAALQPL